MGRTTNVSLRRAAFDEMSGHAGDPQLPVVARLFLLPPDRAVSSVEIVPIERHVLQGHYRPFPILTDSLDAPPDSPPWEEIVYPRQTGFLVSAGQARRYRLAKVQFWPLEYDAATEQLTILTAVRISLQLRTLTAEEERNSFHIQRPDRLDDPLFRQRAWIAETVVNPDELDRYYPVYQEETADEPAQDVFFPGKSVPHGTFISEWPSAEGLPADYVIITNNNDEFGNSVGNMQAIWEAYASLRTNLGLPTVVKTVDAIGARYGGFDRPMRIRNFLRECLELWGTTYVLLAGDDAVVPTRRLGGPNQSWGSARPDPPADIWYSFVYGESGNVWNNVIDSWLGQDRTDVGADNTGATGFSSLLVSRLPAKNAAEAQAIVDKIWAYMSDPPSDPYFYRTATIASGMVNRAVPSNELCGVYLCEEHIVPPLDASPLNWIINKEYPHLGKVLEPGCPPFQDVCYWDLYQYIENAISPDTTHWWGDDLRDRLNDGTHFLYHVEHSMRDRLGRPSVCNTINCDPPPCDGYPYWDPSNECKGNLEYFLKRNIDHMDINQALALTNGLSQPKYSIIFSSGSWTNMTDMDAIGEAFIRAPDGGAVAYVGKTATYGGTYYAMFETAVEKLGSATEGIPLVQSWYEALWETPFGDWFEQIKSGCLLQVLADPTLCPVKRAYQALVLEVTPSPLTTLGIQTITAEVTEEGSGTPVEGAIVCLRQGELLSATARTGDDGLARFRGVLVQDAAESLRVTAFKGGLAPGETTVAVQPNAAFVGYSSHELDDCVTGGDCDGVLEVGENVELTVTFKNTGSTATMMGFARICPTPAVTMRLTVNDEYRRKDTLLGKGSANPPAGSDLFRIPLSIEGTRIEGEPTAPGMLTRESFRVWRADDGSGIYTVGAVSPSQSGDTVFTGVIKGAADFASVSMVGEDNDTYFWSGDSIWFSFHGDASEDRLTFRAEAPNWLTLSTSSAAIPALQPADSTDVTFSASILDEVPDRSNLAFTVTASSGPFSPNYYASDFVETIHRPIIDVSVLNEGFGDFGCADTTWRWAPIIVNRGGAEADSVVLTLQKTAGSLTVLDSVVTCYDIAPDSMGLGGYFLLCGSSPADTVGFRATIRQETFHKEFYEIFEHDGGGGGSFDGPANLRADLLDGTVLLRWDRRNIGTGYCIEYGTSEGGDREFLDRIGQEAMRYEVTIPLDAGPYYFYVSVANGGVCGERSVVGPVYPWVREREGWPKLLPETPACAPLVADLGPYFPWKGKVIFAATDRIFAWDPDGTPLRAGSNGVFYADPNLPERSAEQRFVGAMVYGNWNASTSEPEIGGNLWKSGTYLVKIRCIDVLDGYCSPTLVWKKPISSPASPVVASVIQPANRRVLFLSGMRYPPDYVYAWDGNPSGSPIGNQYDQFVTSYPDGSTYNWENLAIGYQTEGDPHHDLIATTSKGAIYCFKATNLSNPATIRWQHSLSDSWLSMPAVGDVDGDGDHDVVVTTMDASGSGTRIFVIDENSGLVICQTDVISNLHAFRSQDDEPPCGPALAQLDDDDGLEIVLADNAGVAGSAYRRDIRVHVFDYADGSLDHYSAMMQIPYTQRNEEGKRAVAPVGTPIVGDFDYDGSTVKPDIFVTTLGGAIAAFEYDAGADPRLSPKPGWPLLLQDTPLPPVLAELDPEDDPGHFSLVTLCRDGWLHVFDLPMTSEDAPDPEWAAYGRDGGNRRAYLGGGAFAPPQGPEVTTEITGVGIRMVRPEPATRAQEVAVVSPKRIRVDLSVYDVSGRLVRRVHAGAIEAGETLLHWDGKSETGHPVASGVYWYRLSWPSGSESRRVVLIR